MFNASSVVPSFRPRHRFIIDSLHGREARAVLTVVSGYRLEALWVVALSLGVLRERPRPALG